MIGAHSPSPWLAELAANAVLFAASPDLLAACRTGLAVMENVKAELLRQWGETEGATPELDAAIADATAAIALATPHPRMEKVR